MTSRALEAARAFLSSDGWPIQESSSAVTTRYASSAGEWTLFLQGREDVLVVFSLLPRAIGERRRPEASELLTRVNVALSIGSFGLDLITGSVHFRTSVDFDGLKMGEEAPLVRNLVYQNVVTVERYLPEIDALVE